MSPEDIVNELIEEGDCMGAVICTLLWLEYDIDSIDYGAGTIQLTISETNVTLIVGGDYGRDIGGMEAEDYERMLEGGEGTDLIFHIYDAAFTHEGDISANKLYHAVGHEMIHAAHMAKGGEFWYWLEVYGGSGPQKNPNRALFLSEVYAYQWNMCNLGIAPVDGGFDFFYCNWEKYFSGFRTGSVAKVVNTVCEW
jgi:hypothetical protein